MTVSCDASRRDLCCYSHAATASRHSRESRGDRLGDVGGDVASIFLLSLHRHLARTRLEENDADREAWLRGAEVAFALIAVVIASAIVVAYSLWRGARHPGRSKWCYSRFSRRRFLSLFSQRYHR